MVSVRVMVRNRALQDKRVGLEYGYGGTKVGFLCTVGERIRFT